MNNFKDYLRIVDYDFSDILLSDKVIVKFKICSNVTPYDFMTLFKDKRGERFTIKRPNKKEIIVGIGREYTWNLGSIDFLQNIENESILEEFNSLVSQTTEVEIDKLSDEYFGIYGGISDGENKSSQEWIDFSDTLFVIPSILAVFNGDEIEFTLFFKVKKQTDFITEWKNRILFLLKLENIESIELKEPEIKTIREIYPEVWQENIKLSLKEIELDNFSRIALSRKNQILLENNISLPAVVKYFINKRLSFIAFESKQSMFITSNPLLSLNIKNEEINAYLYLQKEHLFNGTKSIDFKTETIEKEFKEKLEKHTGYNFDMTNDKTLVGKNLDVYSVFISKVSNPIKDIKILSLLYPVTIIKGYPYDITNKFLQEKENTGYGFWYRPIGFINKKLEANFYTCGNMLVSFSNILTMFTTILVDKNLTYDDILANSNNLIEKNLRLFKKEYKD